eukprot:jgi/Orpsp1_1/1186427/evm.model.d7180000050518.1
MNKKTDKELLVKYIKNLKYMPLSNDELINIKKSFIKLFNELEKYNYDKLKIMKKEFEKYQNVKIDEDKSEVINEISKNLNGYLFNSGIYFITKNKFNNLEILDFVEICSSIDLNSYPYIEFIDLNNVDEDFYNNFQNKSQNFKRKFINYIIDNDKNYKKIITKNINKKDINDLNKHIIIIGSLFKLISYIDDNNDICNKLYKMIKISYKEYTEELICSVLINFNLNDITTKQLLNCLNINERSNKNIIGYLEKFHDVFNIQNIIFETLKEKVIKNEKEIFTKDRKLSKDLKLLLELMEMGYFDSSKITNSYVDETKKNMKKIYKNLKNFKFSFDQLIIMNSLNNNNVDKNFGSKSNNNINDSSNNNNNNNNDDDDKNNELKKRCLIISLRNKDKCDNLYSLLNNKINQCINIYNKLLCIVNIFKEFYPRDKSNEINYYENIINHDILDRPVCDFPNENSIKNFNESNKEAKEMEKLKSSKFFREIYKYIKTYESKKHDIKNVNNAKTNFDKLIKLLKGKPEKDLDLNYKLLECILANFTNEKMDKEINKLISSFHISKTDNIKNINKELKLLKNRTNIIKLFNNITLLLNDFQTNKNENKLIEENMTLLKNFSSLNDFLKVYKNLDGLNLNIIDSNSAIQSILNNMYIAPKLVEFILNKSFNDFKYMSEYIGEATDINIKREHFHYVERCAKLVNELKEKCINKGEIQILNEFINLISNKTYKNIAQYFEITSQFYDDLNKLNVYYLNPKGLTSERINGIFNSSKFVINFNKFNYEYECTADYDIKIKSNESGSSEVFKHYHEDFDDILNLRDAALIGEKNKNNENLIEILDDIQKIIKLLNTISLKGYYKDISYDIIIKDGNIYENNLGNKKELKTIIDELNEIRKVQDKEILNIYESNSITQLIHGRQFSYLYKAICE